MNENDDPFDPAWLDMKYTAGCGLDPAPQFHKKIEIERGLYDNRRGGGVWSGTKRVPGGLEEDIYVFSDETDVPPDARIIQEFAVGDPVGNPYPGNDGRTYQDVHTHGPYNISVGGIPATQQIVR